MANVEGKANYIDCSCPECRTHIASELAEQPTLEDLAAIRQASMELEGQDDAQPRSLSPIEVVRDDDTLDGDEPNEVEEDREEDITRDGDGTIEREEYREEDTMRDGDGPIERDGDREEDRNANDPDEGTMVQETTIGAAEEPESGSKRGSKGRGRGRSKQGKIAKQPSEVKKIKAKSPAAAPKAKAKSPAAAPKAKTTTGTATQVANAKVSAKPKGKRGLDALAKTAAMLVAPLAGIPTPKQGSRDGLANYFAKSSGSSGNPPAQPEAQSKASGAVGPALQPNAVDQAAVVLGGFAVAVDNGSTEIQHPQLATFKHNCFYCNAPESEETGEFYDVSKKRNQKMCKSCSSTRTTYYKAGEMDRFAVMTDEERYKIFEEAKGLSGRARLELIREVKTTNFDEQFKEEGDLGEFKPLSVWKTLGYDVDRIERLSEPCDIREHKVLGTTYRVSVEYSKDAKKKGTQKSDAISFDPDGGDAQSSSSSSRRPNENWDEFFKRRKLEEKSAEQERKKTMAPLDKILKLLRKTKGELKATKLPRQFASDNPMDEEIAKIQDMVMHVDSGGELTTEQINEATQRAGLLVRSMKPFC